MKCETRIKKYIRRSIVLGGAVILSIGFLSQADRGRLTAEMFLTYPLGVIAFYFPRLFEKFLKVWKGNGMEE